MNIKILRNNLDSDQASARFLSNMMITNYKKGLAIADQEIAQEDGIPNAVTTIDPTETIHVAKPKKPVTGQLVSKGYIAKPINKSEVSRLSQQAKDFIIQSKILDNEIDHVVAQMKLENKDEFYDYGLTSGIDEAVYNDELDNVRDNFDEDNIDDLISRGNDISIYLQELKGQQNRHIARYGDESDAINDAIEELEQDLESIEREVRKATYLPDKKEVFKNLTDGYIVERERDGRKGKQHKLNNIKYEHLNSMRSGINNQLKSKKGLRIVNKMPVENCSHELLISIKKISNHITSVLMPLTQQLYDKRFAGVTLQDKNVVIPELYKDMDEKIYILTSLNNQDNTQLIKLDKEFDKLYNLVSSGLQMFVMSTGGSIVKANAKPLVITDRLYEL